MTDITKVRSSEASLIHFDNKCNIDIKMNLLLNKTRSTASDTPTNYEVIAYKNIKYGNNSLWLFSNKNPFRRRLQKILAHTYFIYAVNIVIILNSIFLIFETIEVLSKAGEYGNYVFIILYTIECIMKIISHGFILDPHTYLRDAWNWIDLFVVITGLLSFSPDISLNFLALRIFRLIKPLKSLSFFPSMRVFISTLIGSMFDLFSIYFMMVFFFLLFAILGLTLWTERFHFRCRTNLLPMNDKFEINPLYADFLCGGRVNCEDKKYCINSLNYYPDLVSKETLEEEINNPKLNWGITKFGNIFQSLFVVFLTTTGESWVEIMIMYMNGYNYFVALLYFVLSVVINYYFIINLSVAAMLYNFENAQQVNVLFLSQKKQKEIMVKLIQSNSTAADHLQNRRIKNEESIRSAYRLKYIPIDTMGKKSKLKEFSYASCLQVQCFERIVPQTEYHAKFRFGFYCYYFYHQPFVQYFFYICILIHFIILALGRVNMGEREAYVVDILNITLVCIFVFEIILHIFAVGLYRFSKSAWNVFEDITILISFIEIIIRKVIHTSSLDSVLTALLLTRSIRIFKLFRRWTNFKIIAGSIGQTIKKMTDFLFLFVIFVYMYTLLGCSFFQKVSPDSDFNFDSFLSSLISVIRIIIGDKWQEIFFDCLKSPETSSILVYVFFISLIFFGQITLLNIFIAYLIDNYHRTKKQFDRNVTVENYILKRINFCLKEHQIQLKSSHRPSLKNEKKKRIKTLNKYLQKLQNKEILSEGLIELMNKNKINFDSFEVSNLLEFDVYNALNGDTIKVINFEKRPNKKFNGIEFTQDSEIKEDFYNFNMPYYQKPEFQTSKTLIYRLSWYFNNAKAKAIIEIEIKKSNSSPCLTKPTNRRQNKTKMVEKPIFRFDSYSSSNKTIHQSYNEESEVNSNRPLNQLSQLNSNNNNAVNNKSNSIIENDDVDYSSLLDNNSVIEESFDMKSKASSAYSEPNNSRKPTLVTNKRSRRARFKTTMVHILHLKNPNLNNQTSIESIQEESRGSSIMENDITKGNTKNLITFVNKKGWKEKIIPIIEYMKNSSLFIFHKNWKIRLMIRKFVYKPYFNYTIFVLIILNCIVLCFDNPWVNPNTIWPDLITGFNIFFNILFIIECLLKIISDNFIFKEKEKITTVKSIKCIINSHDTVSNSNTNDPLSMNLSSNSNNNSNSNLSWNRMKTTAKEQYISKANSIINKHKAYLLNPVNAIDFVCVILSIVDMSISENLAYLRILRIFRAIKPIRILTKSENFKMMIECLMQSIPAIANVIFICFIFIFVYALFGVSLFKKDLQYYCENISIKTEVDCLASGLRWYKNPNNFDNFAVALKTNFIIMLADNWAEMMAQAGKYYNSRWVYWYYIVHVFVGYLVILNLFVSVLIQNFKYLKQKVKINKALSLPEKEWIHIQKMMVKVRPKYKRIIDSDNQFEAVLEAIVQSKWFYYFSLTITSLALFILMLQHENSSKNFQLGLDIFSYILTALFNLEIILKIMLFKKNFFLSIRDDLDLFILILCDLMVLLNILTTFGLIDVYALCILPFILRSFRILRSLRTISSFGKLRTVIDTLFYLVPSIGGIGIILLFIILIYGNIGMNVFGTLPYRTILNDNINFRNIVSSALLLFQLVTKDSIGELMNEISYHDCRDPNSIKYREDYFCFGYNIQCYDDHLVNYTSMTELNMFSCGSNFSYFYLISFALIGPLFIMNLCIVIVVEGFNESMKDNEGLFTRDYIEQFLSTWTKYDSDNKRLVKPYEFALIMKEVQPSIGINYDRSIDNMVLSSQEYRDRINSHKELIKLVLNQEKKIKSMKSLKTVKTSKSINTTETIKKDLVKVDNKCYFVNGIYFSQDLKTYTTDREVLMICNKLNLGYIDPLAEKKKKQKDIKEAIMKIEPIDVIDKEYYIHFIEACLALSRFSIIKMMNIESHELRLNVVGSYMKRIWNKKYQNNRDIIKSFYLAKKQREKISPILATKIIYTKLIKPYLPCLQARIFDNQLRNQFIETENHQRENTINNNEEQMYLDHQLHFDQSNKKSKYESEEDKEMDQIIKNDYSRSSRRRHTGSIGNMSFFYNMKQISQDAGALNNQKNIVSIKRLSKNYKFY